MTAWARVLIEFFSNIGVRVQYHTCTVHFFIKSLTTKGSALLCLCRSSFIPLAQGRKNLLTNQLIFFFFCSLLLKYKVNSKLYFISQTYPQTLSMKSNFKFVLKLIITINTKFRLRAQFIKIVISILETRIRH